MLYRAVCAAVVLVLAGMLASAAVAAENGSLKQLTENGITVSYPSGMEAQAKKVMGVAKTSIVPSVELHRQMLILLADPAAVAADIASLLGAEEIQEKTRIHLLAYKEKSEVLVQCFTNIHLMEKAEAVAMGGVDAGVLQVRYVPDTDEFKMGLELATFTGDKLKRSYFPVFVNADGTIRAEDKIPDMAIDFLGSNKAMVIAPVHETVSYMIAEHLKLYHPFIRWFNEGVSGWVTKRVVAKIDPKAGELANSLLSVGGTAKKMRDKVNLIAWPQLAFQNRRDSSFDPELEAAHTQHSIEIISDLLGGNRNRMLARIVGEIKYNSNADTETICAVVKTAAETDLKKTLMQYVPADIRSGMASGEAKKLVGHAERLAQEKKWNDAAERLRKALAMTPEDINMRLNLAWIEREMGGRLNAELQVFLAARLLKQQDYSFHLFVGGIEGNYILGRLAILVGNLESARQFLEPVLEADPNHADARRAIEEIRQLESAARG